MVCVCECVCFYEKNIVSEGQTAGCDVYRCEHVHFCFVPLGFCARVVAHRCVRVSETFVSKGSETAECVCPLCLAI